MFKHTLATLALAVTVGFSAGALAQDDRPPLAHFDGSDSVVFPADLSMQLDGYGTIEFWVAANWDRLDYDPAVLSYFGDQGPSYAIVMTGQRDAIGLLAGSDWGGVKFDFSDGKLHHVAFLLFGEETDVYIDGAFVRTLAISSADVPVHSFAIGSINGTDAGFPGALAGLRIWDSPLNLEDLEAYQLVDLGSAQGRRHPDLDALVGVGRFKNGRRSFALTSAPIPADALIVDDDDSDLLLPDEDATALVP